ncbi:MAG: hypothetical protein PHR57_01410 [Patescibacteria group bacterium]|nr:hypothetical protein [Patescibacteria group bacterium]
MKEKIFMIGDFPILQDEIGKALSHFLCNARVSTIQESDFLIFSKSRRSKKYLAFFARDENPEDIKDQIFELTNWDDFLIIASGSIALSLEEDKDLGTPQFVLRFGRDREGQQLSLDDLRIFQCLEKKISKTKKRVTKGDYVVCGFIIKAFFDDFNKKTPALIEKDE